ncbi:hypothetical protein EDD11_005923 [Mortierella claussenii]|nr:hypothetical protein EDD11_005923 [Mortierella claussenii]
MTNSKQLRDNHNSLSGYYEREPNLPLPFLENADSSMEQAAGTMNEEHLDEKRASPGRGGQRQTQLNELEETQEEYDDQFHYVAYVPSAGFIWELDGLQPGPLRLMPCTDDSWLDAARIEIIARMKSYGDAEDHFVLLAVVKDPLPILLEKLELLKSSKERQALGTSTSIDDHEAQHQEHKPKEEDILADQIKQVETEIQMIKEERAMQQREVQEAEADFRDAVSIFMKAFVNL